MDTDAATHLAENLRLLRESRGLSQARIASLAGIPRPTWSHLESGAGNPTLAVLVKVANALQVRVEELIGPPRAVARLYRAAELPEKVRGTVRVRRLLPENVAGLDLDRMTLPPGGQMVGVPHTPGTREYLTCEQGTVELSVGGQVYSLKKGDVVVFRGDQRHGYRNGGRSTAVCYSVIAFAPVDQ